MVKTHVEESLGANPADASINPADSVAMGVPGFLFTRRGRVFRALAHREYRLLFAAFLINQTGFWVSHLSIQGLMVKLSGNDPFQLGLVFFSLFLPTFLFAPLAGVAADRFDRKRIVVSCYAAIVMITATLAWITATGIVTTQLLLVIAAFMGTAFAFSGPANMAIAANSVPSQDLSSAVSLQSALNNLTRVVGPALAAPFVASGHYEYSFAIFVVAAFVAGSLIALMRLSPYEQDDEDFGIFDRVRSGLDHARDRYPAVPALVTVSVLSIFGVSHTALLSVYAELVLGDISTFAWIMMATGVGALIGALSSGARDASLRSTGGQVMLYGIMLGAFAVTTSVPAALALQVVIGFFYFSVMTSLQTVVQEVVDEAKRGRVMSLFQVAWAGLIPFGSLGMGAAAARFGVQLTLLATASICAGYGLFITLRFAREEDLER